MEGKAESWEYSALVTSLDHEILSLGQLYRDRADCEDVFDELKDQWGGAASPPGIARCWLAARNVALIYNWWSPFVRLTEPSQRLEAITNCPMLLTSIGAPVRHTRRTTLRIASSHGKAGRAARGLTGIARYLSELSTAAEQLTSLEWWCPILSHALRAFLKGRPLRPPPRLENATA